MSLSEHPPLPGLNHQPGNDEVRSLLYQQQQEQNSSHGLSHRTASRFSIQHEKENVETLSTVVHEAKKILQLAAPLVISALSGFVVPLVQLAFVGHLGKHELSIAVLSASFFNVTGYSFIVGSLGAFETLAGQMFGAKKYDALGTILQRALLLTTLLCVMVSMLWTQIHKVMLLFGQEEELAKGSSVFLLMNVPSLFFMTWTETLKRWFMCQSLVMAPTVAALIAAALTPLLNYIFIVVFQWRLRGAALAANLAQFTPLVILLCMGYLREKNLKDSGSPERTWHGFSSESLQNWKSYFKLAIPSAAMVCLEWWTFELCLLMSGWLDNPELHVAVMGLSLNLSGLFYMLPMGIGSASSVRVSNAIGGKLPRGARRSAWTAVGITMVGQVIIGIALILGREQVGSIFSDDREVLETASSLFFLIAICMIGDGLNASIGGALRGLGRQELGAIFNLVSYWCVGIPLAWSLAFKVGMGLVGLWIGLCSCAMLNGMVMALALGCFINWDEAVENSVARHHAGSLGD